MILFWCSTLFISLIIAFQKQTHNGNEFKQQMVILSSCIIIIIIVSDYQ